MKRFFDNIKRFLGGIISVAIIAIWAYAAFKIFSSSFDPYGSGKNLLEAMIYLVVTFFFSLVLSFWVLLAPIVAILFSVLFPVGGVIFIYNYLFGKGEFGGGFDFLIGFLLLIAGYWWFTRWIPSIVFDFLPQMTQGIFL